ncbi:XRE family transcriptional regulator [Flagellimonas nanhaiensis]|uniref:XRE family transcriptional regulator n=2 Tax=Flagellimonas nanhaiensis TaxID=2292706 RepID=A0A371JV20_9FLAO|nr:XRE family transcriptional regulator [Allomuricauda nanhaiensis]
MEHYGLTISSFADKIGVQRSSISHLLSGRNKPSLDFVMKLTNTYPEIDLYWLLHGKGEFPSTAPKDTSPTLEFYEDLSTPKNENKKAPEKKILEPLDKKVLRVMIFYTDGTFESFSEKN